MRSLCVASADVNPEYLDYDTVVAINAEHCGAGAGVEDEGGIRGALGEVSQTWDGVDLHPTLWDKAAVLMRGIAATQYFKDGSKRTGYLCAETFLRLNGVRLSQPAVAYSEAFVLGVAAGAVDIGLAAEWFRVTESRASRFRRLLLGISIA
jgi:death-on-curing protein